MKTSFAATVTDICVAGIRLEPTGRLSIKSNVAVSVPSSGKNGLVRCRVVWASRLNGHDLAGLVFDDNEEAKTLSWLTETLVATGFSQNNIKERRTQVRVRSSLRAFLTDTSDTILAEGTLLNIGRGGAMLVINSETPLGTPCLLKFDESVMPGLAIPAKVLTLRHVPQDRKSYVGLVFDYDDDPSVDRLVSLIFK